LTKVYHVEKYENKFIVFTENNPFYFEAGGQISDRGTISFENNSVEVIDVYQAPNGATGLIVKDDLFSIDQEVKLEVNKSFRSGVSKSHTAAHIVHTSLRNILGDHVAQAGSNVSPGKFRFDFSHTEKVTADELDEIFTLSNNAIFNDFEVKTEIMNIDDAKNQGALAFFGDKYDDDVRVVNIGDFSKELCGGTHVHNSNDVGLIVLLQESSIGSNLRRVEMLSGKHAYEFLTSAYKSYKSVANILQVSEENVSNKLQKQLETLETYEEKIKNFRSLEIRSLIESIEDNLETINKYKVYINEVPLETSNELRNFALQIINETEVDIVLLYASINGKNSIVGATKNTISLDISTIVTEISKLYGGGASKDSDLSIGGGPNNFDTSKALNIAKDLILKES
jgi:alanyl-tRNA synthetase